jgi:hypothetical protein
LETAAMTIEMAGASFSHFIQMRLEVAGKSSGF